MAARRRNQPAGNTPATNGAETNDKPVDSATAPHPTLTMEEYMQRDDRVNYLSLKQAAVHIGVPGKDQVVRNAIKHRQEFQPYDAVIFVKIEGYDLQPLTYVARTALDLYHSNGRQPARNTRAPGGAKRWIVRLTADQKAAFEAGTLDTTTIKLEIASQPHKKKDAAAPTTGEPLTMTTGNDVNGTTPDEGAHETAPEAGTLVASEQQSSF